jgi:hypothetical protein
MAIYTYKKNGVRPAPGSWKSSGPGSAPASVTRTSRLQNKKSWNQVGNVAGMTDFRLGL